MNTVVEWFSRAIELDAQDRAKLLSDARRASAELASELEELLRSHEEVGGFLEKPATNPWMMNTLEREMIGRPAPLPAGEELAGFRVLRLLGSGALSHVYLAHDEELGREVAIKVSFNRGTEARSMAPLLHDGIVTVYQEKRVLERDLKLICMQHVSGCTLADAVRELRALERPWTGRDLLELLDRHAGGSQEFRPELFREREAMAGYSAAETTLAIGIRLCSALRFAHERGVLHLDVKPANVLLTVYGTPMLTDFNTAMRVDATGAADAPKGGTPGYMSPELHRVLVRREAGAGLSASADLYSLGVTLIELLVGKRPSGAPEAEKLLRSQPSAVRMALLKTLRDDPGERYASAAELSRALENALEIGRLRRFGGETSSKSVPMLLVAAMLAPQAIGSVLNISYNSLRIIMRLTPAQRSAFGKLVVGYNSVSYSLCVLMVCWYAAPLYRRFWRGEDDRGSVDDSRLRRISLRLPWLLAFACTLGWLPGAWLFPYGISMAAGPLDSDVYWHFFVSIGLSWLIALNYSFLLCLRVCLSRVYGALWSCDESPSELASGELRALRAGLRIFVAGCGMIPLFGALVAIGFGPDSSAPTLSFRLLLLVLISLGIVGFGFALLSYRTLSDRLRALGAN